MLDCIGGSYWKQNVKALAMDGRWVLYGLMGEREGDCPNHDLTESLSVGLNKERVLFGVCLPYFVIIIKPEVGITHISLSLDHAPIHARMHISLSLDHTHITKPVSHTYH